MARTARMAKKRELVRNKAVCTFISSSSAKVLLETLPNVLLERRGGTLYAPGLAVKRNFSPRTTRTSRPRRRPTINPRAWPRTVNLAEIGRNRSTRPESFGNCPGSGPSRTTVDCSESVRSGAGRGYRWIEETEQALDGLCGPAG